jgi:tetratricopeptide (TPR) repeat protein
LFIEGALSISPDKRLTSAAAMVERIDHVLTASTARHVRTVSIGTVILLTLLSLGAMLLRPHRRMLDPFRFVVIGTGAPDSTSANIVRHIDDALAEWRDVQVTDPSFAMSQLTIGSQARFELTRAISAARRLDAGNLVVVEYRDGADSIAVRATLYDLDSKNPTRTRSVAVAKPRLLLGGRIEFRRLVNGLLRDGETLPWRTEMERQPQSLKAWRSADEGEAALQHWDLSAAERAFRAATTADPNVALAELRLAETLNWSARTVPEAARIPARRAVDLQAQLEPPDSVRANAVLALVESRFRTACSGFRRILHRDSLDLSAWLGVGDCEAQDHQGVRDARSLTGWRFQGSFEAAYEAYHRAGELGPISERSMFQGWLLGRISTVLYAQTNRIRLGFAVSGDTVRLAAFPFLDHDTLTFAPYDLRSFSTGKFDPPQSRHQAAIARNRELLRRFAEEWVRRSPGTAAAYDSLAGWMEVSAGVSTVAGRNISTLEVVRRARGFSTDTLQQVRLAITEVRLLIKQSAFDDARRLADSLLASSAARYASQVAGVAGLAALTGHSEQTAVYLAAAPGDHRVALAGGSYADLPPQLIDISSRLVALAALGHTGDTIHALVKRTDALVASYFADSGVVRRVRAALLIPPLTYTYPDGAELLARLGAPPDETSRAYVSLANGDSAGARRQLLVLLRLREARSPGNAIDLSYRRARLFLALADTTSAIDELDPVLRALPTLAPTLLSEVTQVAALVRAFALRAEVAARVGDRTAANQYARAVTALWSSADPQVRSTVQRMQALVH